MSEELLVHFRPANVHPSDTVLDFNVRVEKDVRSCSQSEYRRL